VANEQVGSPMVNAGAMPEGAVAAPDGVMEQGKAAFMAGGCIGCHAMGGTPTAGVMTMVGPNLTHVGSRTTLVANLMPNTDENMARWLRDPQAVKEGSLMKLPRKLTEEEVQSLVAYLRAHK
jgi:cytochrome c oxidase subunit 2